MKNVIFDSNIFDCLLLDKGTVSLLKEKAFVYITSVQKKELMRIPDEEKRSAIIELLDELDVKIIAHPFSFRNIDFSHMSFQTDDRVHEFCEGNVERVEDALIAVSGINHDFMIVSNDKHFNKLHRMGYSYVNYKELYDLLRE